MRRQLIFYTRSKCEHRLRVAHCTSHITLCINALFQHTHIYKRHVFKLTSLVLILRRLLFDSSDIRCDFNARRLGSLGVKIYCGIYVRLNIVILVCLTSNGLSYCAILLNICFLVLKHTIFVEKILVCFIINITDL